MVRMAQTRRQDFVKPFGRSKRGNLWRRWGKLVLTVFQRTDGMYAWCAHCGSGEGPRYSQTRFETEREALEDLWRRFG